MKRTVVFIFTLVLASTSCRKSGTTNNIPHCINLEIAGNRINSNWWVGSLQEYEFQNKTVYAFQPDDRIIADASTLILDADCNTLCTVGGFGGTQVNMCNGENFFQTATLIRTIWTKK